MPLITQERGVVDRLHWRLPLSLAVLYPPDLDTPVLTASEEVLRLLAKLLDHRQHARCLVPHALDPLADNGDRDLLHNGGFATAQGGAHFLADEGELLGEGCDVGFSGIGGTVGVVIV